MPSRVQTQTGIRKVIEIKFETNFYETGQIKAVQLCLNRIRARFFTAANVLPKVQNQSQFYKRPFVNLLS